MCALLIDGDPKEPKELLRKAFLGKIKLHNLSIEAFQTKSLHTDENQILLCKFFSKFI